MKQEPYIKFFDAVCDHFWGDGHTALEGDDFQQMGVKCGVLEEVPATQEDIDGNVWMQEYDYQVGDTYFRKRVPVPCDKDAEIERLRGALKSIAKGKKKAERCWDLADANTDEAYSAGIDDGYHAQALIAEIALKGDTND